MGRWLARLKEKKQVSPALGPTEPTQAHSVSFVGSRQEDVYSKSSDKTFLPYDDWAQGESSHLPAVDLVKRAFDGEVVEDYARGISEISIPATIFIGNNSEASSCYACRRDVWWIDRIGVRKCGICHPPSNPDQVRWYDDQGEHFEERAAILEYEAGLPRDLAEVQDRTNETAP